MTINGNKITIGGVEVLVADGLTIDMEFEDGGKVVVRIKGKSEEEVVQARYDRQIENFRKIAETFKNTGIYTEELNTKHPWDFSDSSPFYAGYVSIADSTGSPHED